MRHVHTRLRIPFLIAPLLAATPTFSAELPWLARVDGCTHEVTSALLEHGIVVSQRLGDVGLLFADATLPPILERLGCTFAVLDADANLHEHYLVRDDAARLEAARPPLRLLDRVDGTAIVALPRGDVARLLELGVEIQKLFRTPMRLPRLRPATWRDADVASSSAFIHALVEGVSADSLQAFVSTLEAFGTRNATKPQSHAAAQWLAAKFRSYGIDDVQIRTWSTTYPGNVVATIPGRVAPKDVYLVGGHYDSVAPEQKLEPGADDNATGTASLLECARLLAPHEFAATLRIVAFSAEEYGLVGSEAYAARAASSGENILGMINLDMLGYLAPHDRLDLDLITNSPSTWLRDAAREVAATYVPDLPVVNGKLLRGTSDHASFWRHGFHAIFLHEDSTQPSPFIHTMDDVTGLSYNNPELHALCTQATVALLSTLAGAVEVPVVLHSFSLHREADAVRLIWKLAPAVRIQLASVGVQRAETEAGPYARLGGALPATRSEFVDLDAPATHVWYRLALRHRDGTESFTSSMGAKAYTTRTALDGVESASHDGSIRIRFRVASGAGRLRLGIYDVRGRLVRRLVDATLAPGDYLQTWDRGDVRGRTVARGIYFVHLRSLDARSTRKLAVQGR
ncbi:MAG: M28 family peptidase [Candidatus Latescibacterota bacterium]|nr:MAG: M28 family peptidase [Candidatus Latescibacterota bacterium]